MKVIISEKQLRRLVMEFYENPYVDIVDNVVEEITNQVLGSGIVIGNRFDFLILGIRNILMERFGEFLSIDGKKLKEVIDENFKKSRHDLYFCDFGIAGYNLEDMSNYGQPDRVTFESNPTNLRKSIFKFLEKLKNKFPKQWNKVDKKIELSSDVELTPFPHAGQLSKDNDGLTQKIYNWEYTKDLLTRLLTKYINMSEYVDDETFKYIRENNIINQMIDKMDDVMSKTDYNTFGMIDKDNLKEGLNMFIFQYKTYFKGNVKHSPYKEFISLVEGMKNKTKINLNNI